MGAKAYRQQHLFVWKDSLTIPPTDTAITPYGGISFYEIFHALSARHLTDAQSRTNITPVHSGYRLTL